MKKSTVINIVGIFLLSGALLAAGLVSNARVASAVPSLRLNVYAPGSVSEVGDIMQRYMVRTTDVLGYQPTHTDLFGDIRVMDGGYCISCATPRDGTKNIKEAIADAPKFGTTIIGYDFEHWEYTPSTEQADPIGSMDKVAKMAHDAGLKYMFNPDGGYLWNKDPKTGAKYYTEYHWNNAEFLLIQFQSDRYAGGAGGTDIAAFKENVKTVASFVKNKNPNIKIFVQLSLSFNTPSVLIKKTEALQSLSVVDGVEYFYHENQSNCQYCTRSNLITVLHSLRPLL